MSSPAAVLKALREGGIAVVPTESSYALAACVTAGVVSATACERIAVLKDRPDNKPFPVVAALEQLGDVVDPLWVARLTRLHAAGFWPGALSVAVPAREGLPEQVIHDDRIAIRVPAHASLVELCRAVGTPLTATSANSSGEPPALSPELLTARFDLFALLDAGQLPGGAPSTVVSVSETLDVTLIREGAIPWSRAKTIAEVLRG